MTKENNNSIYVTLFNTFKITYQEKTLAYDEIRSDKVIKLLVYLINHRTHAVSSQEIMDVLWQNEEIDNPVGALKNLVYRLRTIFKNTFNLSDCILTGRGSYSWNPEIQVLSDVDEFDKIIKELKRVNISERRQLDLYRSAMQLYQGSFMANMADDHWIIPIVTFYHSSFLSLVKDFCHLMDRLGLFEEMEGAVTKAIEIDGLDEEFHNMFMKSLMGQGKQQLALEHYKATAKMFYEALGTRPSEEMQSLYKELQKIRNDQELDLLTIQKELEEDEVEHAYFCEYGTFKDIYCLQARMAGRLGISVYISLITVLPNSQIDANTEAYLKIVSKAMDNMGEILKSSLRVGDIVARYSNCQYVALLPTCTFEDATNVMQRLLNKFYVGVKNSRTKVQYNLQELVLTDPRYR